VGIKKTILVDDPRRRPLFLMKHLVNNIIVIFSLTILSCSNGRNHSAKDRIPLSTDDSEKLYDWSLRMFGNLYDPKANGSDSDKWKVYNLMAKNFIPQNHYPPFIRKYNDLIRTNDSSYFSRINELTAQYGNKWPIHFVDTFYHILSEKEFDEKIISGKYEVYPYLDTNFVYPRSSASYLGFLMQHPKYAPTLKERSFYNFPSFTDINGVKYDHSSLTKKVIVINYWFIACLPCREEMSELNRLVYRYKDNPSIIFIGIAPDSKEKIKSALKTFQFNYRIIPDSGPYLDSLHLEGFPSHEVIDKTGKVIFACTESGERAIMWLTKAIEQALANKN
jgi:thiol-disulfide isomerase/thioredoxin